MDQIELLLGYAGLGVALAGFSGLVVAVRTSSGNSWHPRDIWSLSWMLGGSMGAAFLALCAVVLLSFDAAEKNAWPIASLLMGAYLMGSALAMNVYDRRLTKGGHPPRVKYFPASVFLLFLTCGSANLLAATGLTQPRGVYVLGLTASLFASALSLLVFLVILAREASRVNPPSSAEGTVADPDTAYAKLRSLDTHESQDLTTSAHLGSHSNER